MTMASEKTAINKYKKAMLHFIANRTLDDLKRRVAEDTSKTRKKLNYKIKGNEIIFYGPEHCKWLEFGTPPHVIRPKNAKALTIPSKGGRIVKKGGKAHTQFSYGGKTITTNKITFAKEVYHPGTRPQPFLRPAFWNDVPDSVKRFLELTDKNPEIIDSQWL